jgi:hypothetical protein
MDLHGLLTGIIGLALVGFLSWLIRRAPPGGPRWRTVAIVVAIGLIGSSTLLQIASPLNPVTLGLDTAAFVLVAGATLLPR